MGVFVGPPKIAIECTFQPWRFSGERKSRIFPHNSAEWPPTKEEHELANTDFVLYLFDILRRGLETPLTPTELEAVT